MKRIRLAVLKIQLVLEAWLMLPEVQLAVPSLEIRLVLEACLTVSVLEARQMLPAIRLLVPVLEAWLIIIIPAMRLAIQLAVLKA